MILSQIDYIESWPCPPFSPQNGVIIRFGFLIVLTLNLIWIVSTVTIAHTVRKYVKSVSPTCIIIHHTNIHPINAFEKLHFA